MKRLSLLLIVSTLCPMSQAQTTLRTELVKKMVVFLYASDNNDPKNTLGTGFLIFVPAKGNPNLMGKDATGITGGLLLITARHIVDPAWNYCSRKQADTIYMRVNKKDYDPTKDTTGVDYLPVPLVKNGVKQYFVRDDDDKEDAAVLDVGSLVKSSEHDVVPLRISVFANSDEMAKLQIGDPIASAGVIPGESGEKRNYPFFKFGEISNIPDESILLSCDPGMPGLRLERVWFIATNLVSGNSGSPIFYAPSMTCEMPGVSCNKGLKRGAIIGVQSSSFGGADIAGMTPIEDVFKIIEKHWAPELDLYRGDETLKPK